MYTYLQHGTVVTLKCYVIQKVILKMNVIKIIIDIILEYNIR